ncbi:MAG: hypothetical protein LBQ54_00235 [Planctomycetaceae bacterium]|jgi:hypothetical protein|nr:hypothetical protein [Planctomycetaceae bacterium]
MMKIPAQRVTLRRVVSVLAFVTLVLAVILMYEKRGINAKMEETAHKLRKLRDDQSPLFDSLIRNHQRYFELGEKERQRIRKIYQGIKQSQDSEHLEKTMGAYCDWLQTLLQSRRMEHQYLSNEKKLSDIRESLVREEETVTDREREFQDRLTPLQRTEPTVYLNIYRDWIDQEYKKYIEQIDNDGKKNLQQQVTVFAVLFRENPDLPGIFTKTAILRIHSKTPPNQMFDLLRNRISVEEFRSKLTPEALEEFDKRGELERPMFIQGGIIFALSSELRKNDVMQLFRTRRFTREQEKLFGEILSFFPDKGMDLDSIVKSHPDQFVREMLSRLLWPGIVPFNRMRVSSPTQRPGGGFGGGGGRAIDAGPPGSRGAGPSAPNRPMNMSPREEMPRERP